MTFPDTGTGNASTVVCTIPAMSTDPNRDLSVLTESVVALATQIAAGEVDPQVGASRLWLLRTELASLEQELRVFAGLASEWQDAPGQRAALEDDIRRAADRLRAQLGS